MKKFFATLIAVLLIQIATCEAAYITIPNFYLMANNSFVERIRYLGSEQLKYKGVHYVKWEYLCVDGKTDQYVARYLRRLADKGECKLIEETQTKDMSTYFFIYTGAQAKYIQKIADGFHVAVIVNGDKVRVCMVGGIYPTMH